MSVSNHVSSQESVTSQYRDVIILISSDEESHDKVKDIETHKGANILDIAGPSAIQETSTKANLFDPLADAYYDGNTKTVIRSNKRTSKSSSGMNKHRAIDKDAQPIILLSSSDESSG